MLRHGADTAAFYAAQTFSGGKQSLTGLPTDRLGVVTVTRNTGRWVELRAGVNGTCRTAVVTATDDFGEISPC